MSDYDDWDDAEQERAPTKEIYERLIGTLDHNTGGQQPPLHYRPPLRSMICRGPYKIKWVDNAFTQARTNGEIFRWEHPDDGFYVGIDDADALREKVASYAQRRNEPWKVLIAVANQRIQHLESD